MYYSKSNPLLWYNLAPQVFLQLLMMTQLLFGSPSFISYKHTMTTSLKLITRKFPLIRDFYPNNHPVRTNYLLCLLSMQIEFAVDCPTKQFHREQRAKQMGSEQFLTYVKKSHETNHLEYHPEIVNLLQSSPKQEIWKCCSEPKITCQQKQLSLLLRSAQITSKEKIH